MMAFSRRRVGLVAAALCLWTGGCVAPQSQVAELRVQNQNLAAQSRAQQGEIETLKSHCRATEDQLRRAEEELALADQRLGLDDQQLAGYRQERESLRKEYVDALSGRPWISPESRGTLAELARRCPELELDPHTGIAKLQSDILFDSGKADLKPGAENLLHKVASLVDEPEGKDLRIMVVGHTDDQQIVRSGGRESYGNNFDLSAARALTVANRLRGLGVESGRIGMAGFGAHQPIVGSGSAADRYKNRRVEVFVMAPDVPVVGWTETTPTVY